MNQEKKQERVERILSESDIVWSRYGSDTIADLAQRIIKSLKDKNHDYSI